MLVAPLAGAWIEIKDWIKPLSQNQVAPLAGAWIEIFLLRVLYLRIKVAPLAGAWIEILDNHTIADEVASRSPRGSVD